MLDKYTALTGEDYSKAFEAYTGYEYNAFSLLVKHGFLDLWSFFDAHKKAKREPYGGYSALDYVWHEVEGVKTPEAFAFWKRFFEEYKPQELSSFFCNGIFHEAFFKRSSYSYTYGECPAFYSFCVQYLLTSARGEPRRCACMAQFPSPRPFPNRA